MSPTKTKKKTLQDLEEARNRAWEEWQAVREELAGIRETLNEAIRADSESIIAADVGDGDGEVDFFDSEDVSPNVAAVGKRFKNLPILEWSRHIRFLEADHAYRRVRVEALDKRIEPLGKKIEEKREELRKLEAEIASMHGEHRDMLEQRREAQLDKHDEVAIEELRANPPSDSIFGLARRVGVGG